MDEKDIQLISKEIDRLRAEVDLSLAAINKWQDEQDKRIEDADKFVSELEQRIMNIKTQLDIAETRQKDFIEQHNEYYQRIFGRINNAEHLISDLDNQIRTIRTQLEVVTAKQKEFREQAIANAAKEDEFKAFLLETQRTNKGLWIPIIFSIVCTLLSAFIPLIF